MNSGHADMRVGLNPRGECARADRLCASWLRRRFDGSPRPLWIGNVLLLGGSAVWIFVDPEWHSAFSQEGFSTIGWETWRTAGVVIVLAVAAIQLVWLATSFWFGSLQFRRLKSLLILMSLISLWLGLALNGRNLAWEGRRWRLGPYVSVIEEIAQPLIAKWPAADGDAIGLGPFMAYPVGRPTALILLTPPQLSANGPYVSAVEKDTSGAIRFELNDAGGNDWLEWHPQSTPVSHIGGLFERRDLERSTLLTENWYLVRYHSPPTGGASRIPSE